MAQRYETLDQKLISFITEQKMFFTGTAASTGRVNISPKGMDTFRVLNERRVAYLDHTGSGNEAMAHLRLTPRMTIMFCSYTQKPMILRLFGIARSIQPMDPDWDNYIAEFEQLRGQRQIVVLDIDVVQASCGFGVPLYEFVEERTILRQWADLKGDEGLKDYRGKNNIASIDGFASEISSI